MLRLNSCHQAVSRAADKTASSNKAPTNTHTLTQTHSQRRQTDPTPLNTACRDTLRYFKTLCLCDCAQATPHTDTLTHTLADMQVVSQYTDTVWPSDFSFFLCLTLRLCADAVFVCAFDFTEGLFRALLKQYVCPSHAM